MKALICLLLFIFCPTMAQSQDGFYVRILSEDALPSQITKNSDNTLDLKFKSSSLESVFTKYKIEKFHKYSDMIKDPYLSKIYVVKTKDFKLADELSEKYASEFEVLEFWEEPQLTYDPDDYALALSNQKGLDLIRAKDAWEITKGNPDIVIGIADSYLDVDHVDLVNKIESVLSNGNSHSHGTMVAFCAAGDTDNDIGLSSIGFNTSFSFKAGGTVGYLYDLAFAGADIVNASFITNCNYSFIEASFIEAIHDLGTIVVAGAGNGPNRASCGDGHDFAYPASYNHVISVSSVAHSFPYGIVDPTYGAYEWEDCHEDSINNPEFVHTHNDSVDLCAPGYHVHTATLDDSYTAAWGTSFASPIVAGLCALMLDENPNLTPEEVESILKSTAFDVTTIQENAEFEGLLGAGRINAYAAVNAAREMNVTYATLPYSTGFETGLDENWTMYESHRYGRCVRSSDHTPHAGSYHITMDVINNNYYNTNEAWMHLNLSGKSNVVLEFWWKDVNDETHATDGVYISDDGGDSFTKIYNLSGGSGNYTKATIDLSSEISGASLSHSSTFIVKFQQYDNYTMTTDGIAIDDINVCALPAQPSSITGPAEHCTYDWETYYCPYMPHITEYDWTISGIATLDEDGSRNVDVRSTEEGYYTLQVRARNACGWSSFKSRSIWIDACGGPLKVQENPFNIHPNPTDDMVIIELREDPQSLSAMSDEGFDVNVYNQLGNLMISEKTNGTSVGIKTNQLLNGTYIFRIAYRGSIYSHEIIVQH